MITFIEVLLVSLSCLLLLGVVGLVLDYWERQAYERRRHQVDPPEKVDPWSIR